MSTPAQIDANRANSQESTGPRTEEGKARSAANARTHGLTGRNLVILPGEEQEFDDLQTGLYEETKPEGALEDEFFKALIHAAWSQRRCRRSEAGLQNPGVAGCTIEEVLGLHRDPGFVVSRIGLAGRVDPATPDTRLARDDIVAAVGEE